MRNKNITLGYLLIALNNAFFWYAPWLLYLYQFINIQQATTLQLIGLVTRVIAEIPTGAMSDLIGKKKTLFAAFTLTAIGETMMAFTSDYTGFVFIFILINIGYSLSSGTMDAFIYDSLVELKSENKYPKVLSKINAYTYASTALATIVGGFLFRYWGGLPFLLTGVAKALGILIVMLTTEPKVDTFKFSFTNFLAQTKRGFVQLLQPKLIRSTLIILLIGSFSTVSYEILDDVAVVDWGYNALGISILYTFVIVVAIPSSFLYEKISKKISHFYIILIAILILAGNYLFAPFVNIAIWSSIFLIRVIYSPIEKAAILDILNSATSSNVRATTLSTYELLVKIPFVILGVPIGSYMNEFGVKSFSVIFAGTLLILLIVYLAIFKLHKN